MMSKVRPPPVPDLPQLPRSPSLHAVLTTPVDRTGACRFLSYPRGLHRLTGGSASTTSLSRPSQASLALRPAGSLARPNGGLWPEASTRPVTRPLVLSSAPPASPSLEEYWPDIDGLAHRETVTDETIAVGAPPGTFFDFSVIHLVTTATLASLSRAYPQGDRKSVV